jgi:DNA-cytosine methyltransferase
MSKEILKGIFEENIAPVREDITFEGWVDKIRDNEEYKVGLFENYVQPSMPEATFEEFNSNAFGSLGKVEAPLAGAQSEESFSPTESVSSEFEVGPPAGGTPPGVEPKGAPVSDAIEPIEPGEPEAPAVTVGLEEFNVIDNKKDKGFLETIFGWLGGEKTFERVESKFEDLAPSRQRLFQKGASKQLSEQIGGVFTEAEKSNEPEKIIGLAAKGYLSTNTFADYLAGDFASDKVAAGEISTFLEKGVEGQSETFKRFKGSIDPIIAEQSNEIKQNMLKDRDYIGLTKEIDREFASQRAEIDAKYVGVIDAEKQVKLNEATELLRADYDAAMLSLPTESDVTTKKNEMLTRYQLLVNDGKMDSSAANAELQKEYNSYVEDIKVKADEIVSAYNSGLEKAAEKIQSGLKDSEEYKQYISELTELRNGIVSSREEDLRGIQTRIQGDLAPKYNEKINSAIKGASSGPTPLLEKSGLLPTIQKVLNNKGFDLLPFDQKKSFLDRAFGNVVVQLRENGVPINDGTIAQARNEFDDAIMSKAYFTQKGTPSLYMLKTRAIEEAEKLDEVIASTKAKTSTKTFTSGVYASEFGQQGKGYDDNGLDQLLLAREKLQEIIDLPESMSNNEFTNFWNGLSSGQFVDYLPFVSGLKNLSGSLALYRSLEDDTPASRYLQNAVALGNSYKGVYEANNMASDWYKAGASNVESIPFMGEFVFTAGVGSFARKSTEKYVTKLLGTATEKTFAGKGMRVLAGTVVGALAQTTANPQRYIDETIKRMTPQMSIAFSEEGDDLIAMLDESTAEGGFEAFLKGYGVTASEYLSENLGFAGARALKYAGSKMMQNEFLKRALIGFYMSKLNIDMPTAFKRLAGAAGYNGLPIEFMEEVFNMPLTNLITGDADVMAGILTESGDLDIESLMEVGRALVPISAVGVGVNVGGIAVKSMTPENVTISYRDINNLPTTETINKGVWDAVTEVMKSPSKVRDFIANELPKLKVDGKGRAIVTSMLERSAIEFDRGVVGVGTRQVAEATSPLEVTFEPIPETGGAPKVEIIAKRRQKLNKDRTKLVPTGGFDYFAKVGDREVKLSDAEYKAYKDSGVLPERVSAVEVAPEVEGEVAPAATEEVVAEAVTPEVAQTPEVAEGQPAEVISPEVAEVLSTEDTTRIALESLEVLPEGIESAEEGARIYHEAIGKEERTEAEDAVVMAVEDAVIGGAVVPEVAEAVETAEAVTPEEVSTEGVTPEVSGVVEVAEGQKQPSRVATFFSGAGTMEASLPNAQSVMAVEFNPAYVEAYNKAFGVEYEAKDVRDINPEEVIASKPDIFHASPVCKNFSAAKNKRTVLKSDMESADAVARVIREAQPPIVTIENVPDYQGTVPFETIVKALEDAGYTFDVGVYNSADFGGVQNRERLLIRAVKSGELPPIQEKTAPGDWYSAIEDLIESAPDSKFESRSESENWEMTRIKDMVRKGKLDATKPIITMGGSASRGLAAAANAGGPAPTLLSTSRSVPRIILPDGTVKRVTPEMMRRLMGLPESYPIPSNPKVAKEVLGNGVDGAFTRALIDPLLNRAETQPSAEGLTSKEKAEQAKKRSEEIAEKIRKNLRGRGGITGITPFSRAKRLAEVDRATLALIKDYIYQKVLAGAYTFKDFVEDMKENSKRLFGVQIEVADSDKSIFHSARSRFEINDAFAQEILDLKDDFLFSIAAMSGRMNMNFQEFISSNSALVNGFVNRAESIYGLDDQAMMLVQEMYQDALRAAANRAESYTTLEDVKKFHETKEELLGLERDMERARINEEIKRRRNWLSRNFDKFQRAFITPVKNFNRAFGYRAGKFSDYRTSQERDVYSARKYRMGASTKAGNWYNAIHNKIYGGLSWFEKVELDKYLIYRRIVEVSEVRNQRAAEHKKLEAELAAGATPVRKQEIKEAMAELEKAGMGEVKSGSIMVDGKKEEYTVALAEAFVNDINARNDNLAIKIRNRAEMYTEANNELLKMRLDSGEISQEAYDSMQKRDYVRRLFVDLSNTTLDEANYSPVSKEIKAIKNGSEDAILEMDTQALLQINAQITFDSVAKNNFIKKVVGWSEAKQQDYLDKALEKFKDARARTERYLRSSPRPLTQDEIDRFIKEQTLFIPLSNDAKVPSGFAAQKYFVDGVEKRVAVRNDIANIFQTPSGRGINENSFAIKLISALLLTPVIKASAVFVNPAFAIGNFALDVIHASMVTRDLYKSFTFNLGTILAKATGYTAENIYRKAVKYGASLFGRTARDSKFERLVKDYFEHGGGMSGLSNPSSRMYSDKLSSSALRRSFGDAMDGIIAVLDIINSLQSGSELITRVIVYEAALDKNIAAYREKNGVDPVGEDLALMKMSAAASSADLIDFREGAEATKALDQTLFPFLNAMIQGAKAEIDFASKNPLLAAARLAEFGGMALGVALYNANSGDEDEKEGIVGYNGITDYIKSSYFVMMMPWTKKNERGEIVRPFLSIKLPAALKATNILVSGMVADQGAENTIGQMASALEGGYVPEIGSVSPTAQLFMALNYNRDAFRKGAPVYRGRADVLLTERFNAGETKAIYRDLFGAMYDLINEDGENEGVLGFDEAGPAQWQAAFEKAISSNNPYYLGITSTYATISSLYGKDNKKEVDALMDEKFAALNAFRSRVYREPNSSVQQKNMKDRKQVDFLRDQIGSWQKKNDDAIEFAAKTIRDINKLEGNSKNVKIDLFFDREVFNYISDAQMIKGIKDQGIKDIPENLDDLNKVINKEQTRLSLRLLEEFKPNFVFKHPALKSYAQSEDSYVGLNAEMINKIAKEYDSSRNRRSYLIALKFVAGDDFKNIVQQIGAHERDLSVVEGITETTSATKYKRLYLRPDNRSSKPISSESAINNLILLKYLLTNE